MASCIQIFDYPRQVPFARAFARVTFRGIRGPYAMQSQWDTHQYLVGSPCTDLPARIHVRHRNSPQGGIGMKVLRI